MKLIYQSNSTYPSKSANSIQVLNMCSSLSELNLKVKLIAKGNLSNNKISSSYNIKTPIDIDFINVPEKIKWNKWIFAFLALLKTKKYKPDIIYSRCPYSALLSVMLGYKVFFELHSLPPNHSTLFRYIYPKLFTSKNCLGLICITKLLKEETYSKFKLDKLPYLISPDGANPPNIISKYEFNPNKIHIGYVGSLFPGKGMEIIVPLTEACPTIDFHVVGGQEETLLIWKNRTKHISNLRFHGFVSHSKVDKFINSFDIALLPNQNNVHSIGSGDIGSWTSPLKLFEYMANGKAIIASNLPVLQEILTHRYNAFLCDPLEIEQWIQAVKTLANDHNLLLGISTNAKNDFLKYYTWDIRSTNILNFITNIITRSNLG